MYITSWNFDLSVYISFVHNSEKLQAVSQNI